MKLTLISLLCFATYFANSHQQRLGNYLSKFRTFYEPQLAFYYPVFSNQQGLLDYDYNEAEYASSPSSDFLNTEARIPVRVVGNEDEPQSKFFGINKLVSPLLNTNKPLSSTGSGINNLFSPLFNNNRPPSTLFGMNNFIAQLLNNNNNNQLGLNQIFPTFTSTVFQTTTLTVTTPSIVSCISKNQFASTQPCSRKRRGAYVDEIEAIEAFVALAATPVEPLETSVGPNFESLQDGRSTKDVPKIISSKELLSSSGEKSVNYRQQRNAIVSTITSTITTYSFTATLISKYFTLAGLNQLSCLPAGYTPC